MLLLVRQIFDGMEHDIWERKEKDISVIANGKVKNALENVSDSLIDEQLDNYMKDYIKSIRKNAY